MLDLTKIARQMQGISQHLAVEAVASRQRLERAQQILQQAEIQQAELVQQQQTWHNRLAFTAAVPMEPLNTRISAVTPPYYHTVIATDGSQIAPSHHEIAYCYLINVGRVMLHYGQSWHPLLDSLPEVFYQPEDLYISRQWGIRTEEWMGYRRTVSEATALAELACGWLDSLEKKAESNLQNSANVLAMVDGSLIYWFLEQLPQEARDRILPPILAAWEELRLAQVPLMGYVSASRNTESLNFLRLPACPFSEPNCFHHCAVEETTIQNSKSKTKNSKSKTDPPCQIFEPLRDTSLWGSLLEPGQRSPLWRSSAPILEDYGIHKIYFCYVHVGTEIARIEIPEWVAQNPAQFDLALSLMLAQVQKGYGYPVALAEAHNQAVVRGGDRARFFALLEQQMIKSGLKNVGISYKETRKRGSIA